MTVTSRLAAADRRVCQLSACCLWCSAQSAGSTRFGIEPHDAPINEFPKQPSQKDGLGRMCKTHWNAYTAGLARDAKARKTADPTPKPVESDDGAAKA